MKTVIYRKHIPRWLETYGKYYHVRFYTKELMGESEANYRKMEYPELPVLVREEFYKSTDVVAVIEDYETGNILVTY